MPGNGKDPLHLTALPFHIRVDIAFQGDIRVSVSHNLAQCLDVAAGLQASGCKGVTQGVGMHPAHLCPSQVTFDALAVTAGFYRLVRVAGEEPGVGRHALLQIM